MIFQNALDNEETEEKTSCWDHTYWWLKTAKIQGPFIVLPLCNKVVGRIFWQYRRALGGVWSDQMTKVQILGFGNARMYKVRYCQGILQQAVLTENNFFSFCHSVMSYDVICIRMVEAEACSFGGKMHSTVTQKTSPEIGPSRCARNTL